MASALPWSVSMDNPDYMTSVRRFNRVNRAFDRQFRQALAARVASEPGLTGRWLDPTEAGLGGRLPAVLWDDDPYGGYWVACGLQHEPALPPRLWTTFLWANYTSDSRPDLNHRPLDVKITDESSRDVGLLAEMVVYALRKDRRDRRQVTT